MTSEKKKKTKEDGESGGSTKKRAQRTGSNVFAMFTQNQVQTFKEAFQMIDQDKDGFISKNDIRQTFDSLVYKYEHRHDTSDEFNPVWCHIDLPEACVVHPFTKKSMDECDVAGDFWSLMVHNQRDVFTCCKNERDASIVAAPSDRGRGLYYGDAYKLCETIYVDQETCRSRESRDCNYHTASYKNQYIGCFFCRARCENDYQCGDLGRVCSICRPEQPATACTEPVFADSGPLKLYHVGQSTQSGSYLNNIVGKEMNSSNTNRGDGEDNNGNKQFTGQQQLITNTTFGNDESRSNNNNGNNNSNSNQTISG